MKPALCFLAVMTTLHAADYSAVTPHFAEEVRREMKEWTIEGIATAWVDGTEIVYEEAFGEAEKNSVFRAGSISKMFNAVMVMQLVERGKLDLDTPVDLRWLPESRFANAPAVTLRHLLSHRSGLPREVDTGGYFDDGEPSVSTTVESLHGTALATQPGEMTRYSNIAPTLAGRLAEEAAGVSFPEWQAKQVLAPLRMSHSAWLKKHVPGGKVIPSHMRVADGQGGFARRPAPLFDLGTVPAGNLYTTAADLGRFLAMLGAEGDAPGGRVLQAETLKAMYKPQFVDNGPYGIGFALSEFRGRRTVGHGGAVYGHSTSLVWLPEEKMGVVVLSNEDIANGRIKRLADLALDLMLKAKFQIEPPEAPKAQAVPLDALNAVAGAWESASYWWEINPAQHGSTLTGNYASQPCTLIPTGRDTFFLQSRIHAGSTVALERDEKGQPVVLKVDGQTFTRVPASPRPLPTAWKNYLGSYGPDFIPVVVHEKHGRLYATTENMVDYRLAPVNRHVFELPLGMYVKEYLTFHSQADGSVWGIDFAGVTLPRLETGEASKEAKP